MNMPDSQSLAFKQITVLMGGISAERDISIKSGKAIVESLQQSGFKVEGVLLDQENFFNVIKELPDRADVVFIALHGRGGEDGTVQAILDVLNMPYTGSGVLASALAMDKVKTKQLWQGLGLPTAKFEVVRNVNQVKNAADVLGFPIMVKPAQEGSSIGMAKAMNIKELGAAVEEALAYDKDILLEQWLDGDEYTVAIVADEVFPIIQLKTDHEFYDFEAKYQSDTTQYLCPSNLSDDNEAQIQLLAKKAFQALGCEGWGRVDVMCDSQQNPFLLEVNTVPGMTDHSLVPMAAKAHGYSFGHLLKNIINDALQSTKGEE